MESQDLRRAGLKVTLPRLKILEILAGEANRHQSAEDRYKRLLELQARAPPACSAGRFGTSL